MSKRFILFVISFFISLNILLAQDKDNCIDRDRQICINTIKKFPYSQLLEDLKRSNDFFILVLTYNSDWGMYPSYIFVDKPIQLLNNKANIIVLNKKISDKISKLINSYIDFEKPLFVKHGGNSLPANFHVIVVYKNGRPCPKLFRKYHVKTVKGANDYETMKEVVYRRYLRLVMENEPLPDLILMDGGQIQVNACLETLQSLNVTIPVAGIQKDDHHKAKLIYYAGREITLSKNSPVFLLISNISQRVHDFAISFFRSTKAKGLFASRLDGIKGLGKARKEKLLSHFITIDAIKKASVEEIVEQGIPQQVAEEVLNKLNEDD